MEDNVEKKEKGSIIVPIIVLIIFVIIFVVTGIKVLKYYNENKSNTDIINELSKDISVPDVNNNDNLEEKNYTINFEDLKEKNPDTVGYLKVNGTDVSFVVVQAKDNDYYLHHNFNKEYNSAGWIFLDYRNKLDGNDKNTIIYGHNMRTDIMFGTLTRILSDEWIYNLDNRIVTFITEKGANYYKVFSVYQIEDEAYYITTDFKEGDFKKYLDTVTKRSKYDFKEEVDETDQILTLSTCANNSAYRIVLHAKKIK